MANEMERTSLEPRAAESMVAVFSSSNRDGEMEAMAVMGVLESNGIPAIFVGPHTIPSLEFQVQVPEHLAGEAERILSEARQTGPAGAEEAEAATE